MQTQFDNVPFDLTLEDGRVTLRFPNDPTGYGWEGVIGSSDEPGIARVEFSTNPDRGAIPQGIAITDEVEAKLAEFFTANGLDWASEKSTIDAVRAQHVQTVGNDAPAGEAPTAPIAQATDLPPAAPSPDGTHVVVANAHVSLIQRLIAGAKAGEHDLEKVWEAIEHVFGKAA